MVSIKAVSKYYATSYTYYVGVSVEEKADLHIEVVPGAPWRAFVLVGRKLVAEAGAHKVGEFYHILQKDVSTTIA